MLTRSRGRLSRPFGARTGPYRVAPRRTQAATRNLNRGGTAEAQTQVSTPLRAGVSLVVLCTSGVRPRGRRLLGQGCGSRTCGDRGNDLCSVLMVVRP
jgi:hypothetical protein